MRTVGSWSGLATWHHPASRLTGIGPGPPAGRGSAGLYATHLTDKILVARGAAPGPGTGAGGHGQVVALVGEAGVGKSRLVYEVVHSHRTQGWRVLESASVSYGKATPYFPVIDLLRRYCHVDDAR